MTRLPPASSVITQAPALMPLDGAGVGHGQRAVSSSDVAQGAGFGNVRQLFDRSGSGAGRTGMGLPIAARPLPDTLTINKESLPPALQALATQDDFGRKVAAMALAKGPDSVNHLSDLQELLHSPFWQLREAAVIALGALKDVSSTRRIQALLWDQKILVVAAALRALFYMGPAEGESRQEFLSRFDELLDSGSRIRVILQQEIEHFQKKTQTQNGK